MTVEKVLVKDSEGTFEGKLIWFPGKVPDELLCVVCKNISSKQLQDSQGHIYCESCVCMLEDDGSIQWDIGDTTITTDMDQLTECNSAFNRALELPAKCPKEGCTFQTSLRNLFEHYRRCQPAVIANRACPLCSKEMHPRLLPDHISLQCDYRVLTCPYCTDEHTANSLENHLDVCDHRPATCEHCQEEFDTFMELRDQHLDVCSLRPEKCPYDKIGCTFQGVALEVQKHVGSCSDARLLMEKIAVLTAKVEAEEAQPESSIWNFGVQVANTMGAFSFDRLSNAVEILKSLCWSNTGTTQVPQDSYMDHGATLASCAETLPDGTPPPWPELPCYQNVSEWFDQLDAWLVGNDITREEQKFPLLLNKMPERVSSAFLSLQNQTHPYTELKLTVLHFFQTQGPQ